MPVLIQFRRDTAANWTAANTTLAQGEMGIETDTNLFKIGNGSTAWNSLPYGGIQGIQGVQGTTGIQGVQGLQGAIGAQGTTGDTGVQGLTGSTGAQGTTGAQGIQGTQGLQGTDANVQGIQGVQGADGANGSAGSQGVQGITGAAGSSSLIFDYTIDTDSTGGDPTTGFITYAAAGGGRSAKTVTPVGNVVTSTAQSKFGGASALFDGNGDSLSIAYDSAFDIAQNNNWTFECWYRPTNTDGPIRQIVQQVKLGTAAGWWLDANGTSIRFIDNTATSTITLASGVLTLNTWHHIALVRRNTTTLEFYVDGVRVYQNNSYTAKAATDAPLRIGQGSGIDNGLWVNVDNFSLAGYLDEVRVSTVARYDGNNFTPSASSFAADSDSKLLLHMDGANNATTFTDDPGVVDQTTSTQLQISKTAGGSVSAANYLALLQATSRFIIQDAANATNQQTWRVTGALTNNANHYDVPVALVSSGGTGSSGFVDNTLVKLALQPSVQGVQGITGNQGIQGLDGTAGSAGSQGVQGITGNQGTQGIQGLGFTNTITTFTETVYAIGNSGTSTLTPDAANGTIQTITATGNFTLNAFANPQSGQTITFIITQDGTGSRTLTSTMLFASASKTLSTAANSVDILTVSYVGTTYYASLSKGFA